MKGASRSSGRSLRMRVPILVAPAQAGAQLQRRMIERDRHWVPAYAGMTDCKCSLVQFDLVNSAEQRFPQAKGGTGCGIIRGFAMPQTGAPHADLRAFAAGPHCGRATSA